MRKRKASGLKRKAKESESNQSSAKKVHEQIENEEKEKESVEDENSNDAPPKNTLAGLPEELLHMIIPHLGLKDRSSVAATCKRLYNVEATAGMSKKLVNCGGIRIERNEILLRQFNSFGPRMILRSVPFSRINYALRRVFRTVHNSPTNHPRITFFGSINFNDPYDLADFDFLSEFGVRGVELLHHLPGMDEWPIVKTGFVDILPTLPAPPINSHLFLRFISIPPCDMLKLFEKFKTFEIGEIHLSKSDFLAFGEKVLGIKNISFLTRKKQRLATSREHEQVYYRNQESRFFMVDGQCTLDIEGCRGRIEVKVVHGRQVVRSDDCRIPFVPS